jgi:hypothetical protein
MEQAPSIKVILTTEQEKMKKVSSAPKMILLIESKGKNEFTMHKLSMMFQESEQRRLESEIHLQNQLNLMTWQL